MRQLDEWDRLRASLPPLDARVVLKVGQRRAAERRAPPDPGGAAAARALRPGGRRRRPLGATRTTRCCARSRPWCDRGMVELRQEPRAALAEAGDAGLFSAAQIRRLRDWLQAGGRGAPRPWRGQAAGRLARRVRAPATSSRLLAELPGMHLAEPARQGRHRRGLARSAVGSHRRRPGHRNSRDPRAGRPPLRADLAGGGARRARDLSCCSAGSERRGRRHAATALATRSARCPRARIFHLLLLHKGERRLARGAAGEARARSTERRCSCAARGRQGRRSLLRTLLGRVIP